MWQDSLIESGDSFYIKRWFSLPVSLIVHGIITVFFFAFYYVSVEMPPDPAIQVVFFRANFVPLPPPAPAVKKTTPAESKPVVNVDFIPDVIPDLKEVLEDKSTDEEPEQQAVQGVEGGIEGGWDGGAIGGVPGGILGGVPDGLLSASYSTMAEAAPLELSKEIKQPVRIRKVKPHYPNEAQKARITGIVRIRAIITELGDVEDAIVLQSLNPLLDQCAVDAVLQWKYRPAIINSRPVRVFLNIAIKFSTTPRVASF